MAGLRLRTRRFWPAGYRLPYAGSSTSDDACRTTCKVPRTLRGILRINEEGADAGAGLLAAHARHLSLCEEMLRITRRQASTNHATHTAGANLGWMGPAFLMHTSSFAAHPRVVVQATLNGSHVERHAANVSC